jgi:hypothetical protein
LKENDVVKKAVEGGFDFNGLDNGMALDKYVASTGLGRHGPHPSYTNQIGNHLNLWKSQYTNINGVDILNSELSPELTADYLKGLADDIRGTIEETTGRINLVDLGL